MSVVKSHRNAAVGWITFNRPEVLNAMNQEVFMKFERCVKAFDADPEVRVIAITGTGRAFSTGADIRTIAGASQDEQRRVMQAGHAMMATVEAATKPVVAAVNGIAAGGGFELSLACDFVFAERRAQFGLTEIRYGFLPGGGGTQRLPRAVSWSDAMYLLCSGDLISAQRAADLGIVFRLVSDGEIGAAVQEFSGHFSERSAAAVASAKTLIRRSLHEPLEAGLRAEIAANLGLLQSETAIAAMTKFLNHRSQSDRSKTGEAQ